MKREMGGAELEKKLPSREKASRFVILGMLALGKARSGYEIKKAIEASTSSFWSESYGNLYPKLKQLLSTGEICRRIDPVPAGNRHKQLYGITAKGKRTLSEWLRTPTVPRIEDNVLLLKLFFGALTSVEDSQALVRACHQHHARLLENFEEMQTVISKGQATKQQKVYWLATLQYGQSVSRALLQWSRATETALGQIDS